MAVLYRRKVFNPGKQNGVVAGVCFTKEQIICADAEGRTEPDDVFRAQCFLAKFRRGNGLRSNARFFGQFLLCHAELFSAT